MKKNLLGFAVLALAVLFTAAGVKAQGVNSYRAHVPFDFVVGQKTYDAGDYLIRFEEHSSLTKILKISSSAGRELQVAAAIKNGKTSGSEETVMVFSRFGEDYVLSQILCPDYGFRAPKVDTATWVTITKNHGKKPETVTVVLRK